MEASGMAKVLLVDDEEMLLTSLRYALGKEGFIVATATDGLEALEQAESFRPDVILLDVMIPGVDGFEVCRELRAKADDTPVILLTAKDQIADRVNGLDLGADDYVSKPFSPQEVVLRVGAVLRRVQQPPPTRSGGRVLRIGPFVLDVEGKRAEVDGRELDLTPTEFRLLQVLMERRGRVQSRRQLLEAVWEVTAKITTRTVDMHVQRLRNKAGEAADWIETVRGFGYRFRTEPPA
jgi:two-component system, OmpR family, phosphate regulon response regulator PhoB